MAPEFIAGAGALVSAILSPLIRSWWTEKKRAAQEERDAIEEHDAVRTLPGRRMQPALAGCRDPADPRCSQEDRLRATHSLAERAVKHTAEIKDTTEEHSKLLAEHGNQMKRIELLINDIRAWTQPSSGETTGPGRKR